MKNNLLELRTRVRLSQDDVARAIGRSHNAVCGYEKGRTSVPMEIREAYAKVLNIEWEDVREWDETSADLCEPVTRGTSDLSYLTSDELVAAISSRAEKLKASDGQVRLDLVRAIVKMAVELEKITEKEEGTE